MATAFSFTAANRLAAVRERIEAVANGHGGVVTLIGSRRAR